jgi:hypothetical protein
MRRNAMVTLRTNRRLTLATLFARICGGFTYDRHH